MLRAQQAHAEYVAVLLEEFGLKARPWESIGEAKRVAWLAAMEWVSKQVSVSEAQLNRQEQKQTEWTAKSVESKKQNQRNSRVRSDEGND